MADAGKDGEDKLTECQVFHYLLLMETPYSHLVFVTSIQVHPTLNLHHFLELHIDTVPPLMIWVKI